MGEKYPRWTYVVLFALLAVVVVLAAKTLRGKRSETLVPAQPAEQSAKDSTEKNSDNTEQQIQALNNEVMKLRKEAETNAGRARELESKLDETKKALAAAQQKLKVAQKQPERTAAASSPAKTVARSAEPPASAKTKTVAKNGEPASAPNWRRSAEAGSYEIIRDTSVLEKPSSASREVALIQKGMTVIVVGSQGDWLEVRSKHGNPPGYVNRGDAMFKPGQSDNK